jgi:hypothetical protein
VKKKYDYDEMSNRRCMEPGCGRRLKKRLVEAKDSRNITHCYEHEPKHRISGHSARGRS